jgi:hypothetical protein
MALEDDFLNQEISEEIQGSDIVIPLYTVDFIKQLYDAYPEKFFDDFRNIDEFKDYQIIRKFVVKLKRQMDIAIKNKEKLGDL